MTFLSECRSFDVAVCLSYEPFFNFDRHLVVEGYQNSKVMYEIIKHILALPQMLRYRRFFCSRTISSNLARRSGISLSILKVRGRAVGSSPT